MSCIYSVNEIYIRWKYNIILGPSESSDTSLWICRRSAVHTPLPDMLISYDDAFKKISE